MSWLTVNGQFARLFIIHVVSPLGPLTLDHLPARLVVPALVILIAGVGYWTVFQGSRPDPKLVSSLILEQPGVAGLKATPSSSAVVPATETTWSVLRSAARSDPEQTGAYSKAWDGAKGSKAALSILVAVLPTAAQAQEVQKQVVSDYTNTKDLKSRGIVITDTFDVATVPGSSGFSYRQSASSASAEKGSSVVFTEGRAVADVISTDTSSNGETNNGTLRSVVQAQHSLLESGEPGATLSVATRSPLASSVYWAIAVFVAAVAFAAPLIVRKERERRRLRQAAQTSRGHRGRGNKVLRRQKVSLPSQSHRRPTRSPKLSSKR